MIVLNGRYDHKKHQIHANASFEEFEMSRDNCYQIIENPGKKQEETSINVYEYSPRRFRTTLTKERLCI